MSNRPYTVNRSERTARWQRPRAVQRTHNIRTSEGDTLAIERVVETSPERAELAVIVSAMSRAFASTVDFYKAEHGGGLSHDDAVRATEKMQELRRKWVKEGMPAREMGWGDISALAEVSMEDALAAWGRVREAADADLESGARGQSYRRRFPLGSRSVPSRA